MSGFGAMRPMPKGPGLFVCRRRASEIKCRKLHFRRFARSALREVWHLELQPPIGKNIIRLAPRVAFACCVRWSALVLPSPAEASFVPYLVFRVLAEAEFAASTTSADHVLTKSMC
jgi:hypothetical protein